MSATARESNTGVQSLHFVFFYHSIVSDWNNGNAHFLRGMVRELTRMGHYVIVYEPRDAWSYTNLQSEYQGRIEEEFERAFPDVKYVRYSPEHLQLDEVLDTADVVIVHEWNDHDLVKNIGRHRATSRRYKLLFHDTHHRSVSDPEAMRSYDLSNYDGVLAFGDVVRDIYLESGWAQRAWTFHEAADTHLFYPRKPAESRGGLLWIGNWGDEERTSELHEYFINPARDLGLKCGVYGVRYPQEAIETLRSANLQYCGFLPNYQVPDKTASYKAMIHVPRRPYVESLPGIPTIRPFEAMACGIPLVSSYWNDSESLFMAGQDYLVAKTPAEMRSNIRTVLNDSEVAQSLIRNGLETIRSKHTCTHRVQQLLHIVEEMRAQSPSTMETLCTANQL